MTAHTVKELLAKAKTANVDNKKVKAKFGADKTLSKLTKPQLEKVLENLSAYKKSAKASPAKKKSAAKKVLGKALTARILKGKTTSADKKKLAETAKIAGEMMAAAGFGKKSPAKKKSAAKKVLGKALTARILKGKTTSADKKKLAKTAKIAGEMLAAAGFAKKASPAKKAKKSPKKKASPAKKRSGAKKGRGPGKKLKNTAKTGVSKGMASARYSA